jgi:hypothetical protein
MSRVFVKFFEKEGKFWAFAFEIGAQPSPVTVTQQNLMAYNFPINLVGA